VKFALAISLAAALSLPMSSCGQPEPHPLLDGPPAKTAEMQALGHWLGEWDVELRFGAHDAEATTGTYYIRMAPDGRWLLSDFHSTANGEVFWGQEAITFDSTKGKFFSTWKDSLEATQLTALSTYDAETRTLTAIARDSQERNTIGTTIFPDNNHWNYQMDVLNDDGTRDGVMWVAAIRK
jgi:hypothetical protein